MRRRSRRKTRHGIRRLPLILLVLVLGSGLVWGGLWWRERSRHSRIARLEAIRDVLERRLAELRAKDPVVGALPRGHVAVGVPEAAGGELMGLLATRILGQVELQLRDLSVRREGRVGGKVLFARVSPGEYRLDAQIHEIRAVLGAQKPELRFKGSSVEVVQPVRIVRGEGRATLDLHWDTRGISNAFCGDFNARIPVSGTVVPHDYTAAGSLELRLEKGAVMVEPSFPDVVLNLQVEPSSATWAELDRILEKQGLRCRTAIRVVDAPTRLREILRRGFKVRVRGSVFRPFAASSGLRRDITIRGKTFALNVVPRELTSAPGFMWCGSDVEIVATRRAAEPASQ
jgi:hypothetical protein